MSSTGLYAVGVAIGVIIIAFTLFRSGIFSKVTLPPFPEFGPLPLADLAKYYEVGMPPIAWERVRGWELNQAPPSLGAPAPIDHVVLTPRLLDFCSSASGRIELVFNFLVGAILNIEFDPSALPPGTAPAGHGLLTVYTPSGKTLLIASGAFAGALNGAIANARAAG